MPGAESKAEALASMIFAPLEARIDEAARACARGDVGFLLWQARPERLREVAQRGVRAFELAYGRALSEPMSELLTRYGQELSSALEPMAFAFEDLPRDGDALKERFLPLYRVLQDAEKPLGALQTFSKKALGFSAATASPIPQEFAGWFAELVIEEVAVKAAAGAAEAGSELALGYISTRSQLRELAARVERVIRALGAIEALIEPLHTLMSAQLTQELRARGQRRRMYAAVALGGVAAVLGVGVLAPALWSALSAAGDPVRLGSGGGLEPEDPMDSGEVERVLGDAPGASEWIELLDDETSSFERLKLSPERESRLEGAFASSAEELRRRWGLVGLCERLDTLDGLGLEPDLPGFTEGCGALAALEAELERARGDYRLELSAYERDSSQVNAAREALERAQRVLSNEQARAPLFVGFLYGSLGAPNTYEVGDSGGRYVLHTTTTEYTTRGRVELRVELCGTEQVTLKRGGSAEYTCLRQADTSDIVLAAAVVGAARSALADARRAAPARPVEPDTDALTDRLERQRARLDAILERASRPAPTAPPAATPSAAAAAPRDGVSLLEGICAYSRLEPTRCARCPAGTMYDDATPDTTITARRELSGGRVLVEMTDPECLHHTNASRSVYLMDRSDPGSPRRLAEFPGAVASRCVVVGGELVCVTSEAHHGTSAGVVVSVSMADGEARALLEFSDSLDGGCVEHDAFVEGFAFEGLSSSGEGIEVALTRRWGEMPLGYDDRCAAEDAGEFSLSSETVTETFTSRAGRLEPSRGGEVPVRFAQWEPSWLEPGELSASALSRTLAELPGAAEGWVLHRRRLGALRYGGDTRGLKEMTERLVVSHPERALELLTELAEDCEAGRDYECARWAHERALARPDRGDAEELAAAWFFATAGSHRDLAEAQKLAAVVGEGSKLEPRRSLLLAELALQRGDVGSARLILEGEPGELVADKLRRLDDPSARLEDAPREQVPARPFKGAREWDAGPPTGAFGPEELAVGLHLRAQALARKKRYADAAALYAAARERVSSDEVRVVVELGWGKLHERAGKTQEALQHYRGMAARYPDHDRVLNRLAWFLLTTPGVHDLELGHDLARRASALTDDRDPSVLDTLVEAHAQRGEWELAARLNVRCRALDPERSYYERRAAQLEKKGTPAMRRLRR